LLITFEWSDWRNGCSGDPERLIPSRSSARQGVYRRLYNAVQERGRKNGYAVFALRGKRKPGRHADLLSPGHV
jgi:hypothetical protein